MNIILYIIVFVAKVIENGLATLRVILIANGKKGMGAFLQFLITIVWIAATGIVIIDINKDPIKVIFFALGSYVGSYLGSIIEEKMALGNNMVLAIVNESYSKEIITKLRDWNYSVTILKGENKDEAKDILMIMVPRKKRHEIIEIINNIDDDAMIVIEKIKAISSESK